MACIGLHSFAMQCKEREREIDSNVSAPEDPFITEGLSSSSNSDVVAALPPQVCNPATCLQAGKAHHEALKDCLFQVEACCIQCIAQLRAAWYGIFSDSDN